MDVYQEFLTGQRERALHEAANVPDDVLLAGDLETTAQRITLDYRVDAPMLGEPQLERPNRIAGMQSTAVDMLIPVSGDLETLSLALLTSRAALSDLDLRLDRDASRLIVRYVTEALDAKEASRALSEARRRIAAELVDWQAQAGAFNDSLAQAILEALRIEQKRAAERREFARGIVLEP